MIDLTSLDSQQKIVLAQALTEAAGFQQPILPSQTKLRARGEEAHRRLSGLERGLRTVLQREFAKNIALTTSGVISPTTASYDETLSAITSDISRRCAEFSETLYGSGFGRIEWLTPSTCRFDYAQLHIAKGILTKKYTTIRHVHDLVDARQHKLPALDVRRPAIVDRIIYMIPSDLHKHLRIVTGLEVVKGSGVESEETKLTGLGQIVYGTRDAVVDGAHRVADGVTKGAQYVAGGAAAVGRALTSDQAKAAARTAGIVVGGTAVGAAALAGTAALAFVGAALLPIALVGVAMGDPCLVLGDLVLVGWESE